MITSRQNSVVQGLRTLVRKREAGRFVLEGPILLHEAVREGIALELLVMSDHPRVSAELLQQAREMSVRQVEVSDDILEYVSDSQHPQGVLAVAREPRWSWPDDTPPGHGLVVVLDEVRDPGNLGTILRTARATGVEAVVLAGRCVDPWSAKVVRASVGAVFRVPTVQWSREQAVHWVAGRRAVAVHAHAVRDLFEMDLVPPVALVFGSESHGVGDDMVEACREAMRIPMAGECESLNLAVATAVTLYQSMAQVRALAPPGQIL